MNKLLAGMLLLSLCSCGIFKKKTEKAPELNGTVLAEEAAWAVVNDPSEKLHWLNAKYDMAVSGEMNINLKLSLRMCRDSAIWMSVSPGFGIEVARILIRPDSVWAIDKINKRYVSGQQAELADRLGLPLDFELLQSLFLAEAAPTDFQYLKTYFAMEPFAVFSNVPEETFLGRYKRTKVEKDLVVAYGVRAEDKRLSLRCWFEENRGLEINYLQFVSLVSERSAPSTIIPSLVQAEFKEKSTYTVRFKLNDSSIDGPFPMRISIPSSYEAM